MKRIIDLIFGINGFCLVYLYYHSIQVFDETLVLSLTAGILQGISLLQLIVVAMIIHGIITKENFDEKINSVEDNFTFFSKFSGAKYVQIALMFFLMFGWLDHYQLKLEKIEYKNVNLLVKNYIDKENYQKVIKNKTDEIDSLIQEINYNQQQLNDPRIINEKYNEQKLLSLKKTNYTGSFVLKDQDGNRSLSGQLENGVESGIWTYFTTNYDGEKLKNEPYEKYQFINERSGAICRDGSISYSTGRGTCSWHGGVKQWITTKRKIKLL